MGNNIKIQRLIICDDSHIFKLGIYSWLKGQDKVKIYYEIEKLEELCELPVSEDPYIIVMRCNHLSNEKPGTLKTFIEKFSNLKFLLIFEKSSIYSIYDCYKAGFLGIISASVEKEEFLQAISELGRFGFYLSRDIQFEFFRQSKEINQIDRELKLTSREEAILKMIFEGMSNKEIALRLYLSVRTIEGYRAKLISKFHAKNMVEVLKKTLVKNSPLSF